MKRVYSFINGVRHPWSREFWITLAIVILILGLVVWQVIAWVPWDGFWEWLTISKVDTQSNSTTYSSESGSTTMRNMGLVGAGLVTVGLLIWRGYAANKQASAAHRQAEIAQQQEERAQQQVDIAQRQAETAQQGLRNERYQRAAEMLGDEVLAVRLGGIYALQRLDEDHPEEYHVQIMRLLCAFVRHPTEDEKYEDKLKGMFGFGKPFIRADVQAVMDVIGKREKTRIALEEKSSYWPDLAGANLKALRMFKGNLRNAILVDADLSNSFLVDTDLTNAILGNANLSKANILGVILSGTFLRVNPHQELEPRFLLYDPTKPVRGLTQEQFDTARADPKNPPHYDEVRDANTDEFLDWQGAPIDDEE